MSWDVVIVNSKGAPADLKSSPDDFESEPLGDAASVRELISSVLPGVDWSDPSWGQFEGDGFSIEFSIGEEDPVQDAMLHVRGGGDPLPSIVRVCKRGGWLAFDTRCSGFWKGARSKATRCSARARKSTRFAPL